MARKTHAELLDEIRQFVPDGGEIAHGELVENLTPEQVNALNVLVRGQLLAAAVRATGPDSRPALYYSIPAPKDA